MTGELTLLLKGLWRIDPRNLVRLTGERFRRDVTTEVLSGRAPPPLAATSVVDLDAHDTTDRDRISVDYEYDVAGAKGAIDRAKATLYRQKAAARQLAYEDRNTAADRVRDSKYDEDTNGASVALHSSFASGGLRHRLVYGGDYSRADITGLRDGAVPPSGELLPQKPFPDTKYTLYGAFAQDEMQIGDHFVLIPGIRVDGYELDARTDDPLYPTLGGQPVSLDGSRASPKLGLIWRFDEVNSLFAQYASGYRAPAPAQVNQGFENQLVNYRSIGNPNLKPETSRTFEAGLRGRSKSFSWDLVGFDGRYRDFIQQVQIAGTFTPADPAIFQNVNLADVRIRGVEARGRYAWANGWGVFGNYAYARGDDEGLDQPLASIDPPKLVLGAGYVRDTWSVQAVGTHLWKKDESRIPPQPASGGVVPASFASPAATIFDLYAQWRPVRWLTFTAAALNLTDRKYWLWTDVRGQLASSSIVDAYTSPGRNYAITAKLEF